MVESHDQPAECGESLAWRLDWNLLRSFLVIVEERSFTTAAQRLNLKQPTVSNALRRLEETLGRRLINRGPREFEITPHGEALFRQATQIFGAIDRLSSILEEESDCVNGTVAISMATHVTSPLVDNVLHEFQERHPKAAISISVHSSRNVVEAVRSKRAAFGICLVRERLPELEYTHLFTEHFGFFCGPTHRLFGKTNLSIKDLRGEKSVSFDTDQVNDVLRPVALLRESAALAPQPAGVSNNLEEVRRMVIAGLGIAPLPIHVVERDVRDGLLWRLPPYESPPAIDLFVVTNPATQLNRAEQEFRKIFFGAIERTPLAERTYLAMQRQNGEARRTELTRSAN
ncbi:MAG: LysR family transcriptional regulator [Parvularculaceae bacterium]|nr:LysR family transcriptional regulator [Caulobacterales bacterium]